MNAATPRSLVALGLPVLLALALLSACGCEQPLPPAPPVVSNEFERGPFKLVASASPPELWVGDPLTVKLEVTTPEGYLVRFPSDEELAEAEVADIVATEIDVPHLLPAGNLTWTQTVRIEPVISGERTIPALIVWYAKEPESTDAEPAFDHDLINEPLTVTVRSALTTQDSVASPREISGPLTPPPEPLDAWTLAAIAAGVLVAGAALTAGIIWLLIRLNRPPPPIPPDIWALAELGKLESSQLLELGEFKVFYYSLSEIVRAYIERQFRLAAPDMTTEEFLYMLARDRSALPFDDDRLREFMQACDMVKYAAFVPGQSEAEHALQTARAFVHATASAVQAHAAQQAEAADQQPGGPAA